MTAGVATAGAVIGNALSSIREEDKNAYVDHQTWSEEAEARRAAQAASASRPSGPIEMRGSESSNLPTQKSISTTTQGRKKTVAVVVSADTHLHDVDDEESFYETAVRLPSMSVSISL